MRDAMGSNTLHDAQMKILAALASARRARFSELAKVTHLSSDHVNFHIKQLINNGLVAHAPHSYGEYQLTHEGKEYCTRMNTTSASLEPMPKISVVLWVRDEQGYVLRQQRLKQPYYGYWTRPTGKVRRGETILIAAARKLREETGLEATLRVVGLEHRIDQSESGLLYDDKYLFMIEGTEPTGELIHEQAGMQNYWMTEAEYEAKEKRFGKPLDTHMTIEGQVIPLTEGIFTFDEADY